MANFNTHLGVASIISGVLVSMAFKSGLVGFKEMFYGWFLGVIGGILPDIDSDHSQAVRLIFSMLGAFAVACVLLFWAESLSLMGLWFLCTAAFMAVRFVLMEIFLHFTVHRGVFHSLVAALVFWVGMATVFDYWFNAIYSWFFASMMFCGYLVHLLLDEMFSVDLMGARVKRSLGTAIKPVDWANPIGSLVFTAIFVGFLFISPPFFPFFNQAKQIAALPFWSFDLDYQRLYHWGRHFVFLY